MSGLMGLADATSNVAYFHKVWSSVQFLVFTEIFFITYSKIICVQNRKISGWRSWFNTNKYDYSGQARSLMVEDNTVSSSKSARPKANKPTLTGQCEGISTAKASENGEFISQTGRKKFGNSSKHYGEQGQCLSSFSLYGGNTVRLCAECEQNVGSVSSYIATHDERTWLHDLWEAYSNFKFDDKTASLPWRRIPNIYKRVFHPDYLKVSPEDETENLDHLKFPEDGNEIISKLYTAFKSKGSDSTGSAVPSKRTAGLIETGEGSSVRGRTVQTVQPDDRTAINALLYSEPTSYTSLFLNDFAEEDFAQQLEAFDEEVGKNPDGWAASLRRK
ncbi:uncharacterized protein L201_007442 [Kwoniella dendrophila CBS 6074]|uniref:Uncharacterized protein n=1 Tax=Kwoniella dendrophila CBS 6074 TaxID=1295534 RepID=A0AAX4K5P2_9TREE